MLVALQLVGAAATPLNFTVLVPCVPPKLLPVIVTDVPTTPDVGLRLLMLGVETLELFTVTLILALLAVLFDVSVATAFSVCEPLAVFVVSHENT
jgi:hypothetical protein